MTKILTLCKSRVLVLETSIPHRTSLDSVDKSLTVFLVLFLFGIYMVTFDGTMHSTDGLSMFAVVENLVKHSQVDIRQLENWENVTLGVDGKPYTVFPIGPTLFMVPFFTLALFIPGLGLVQTTMILMPLCSALSAGYLYLSTRRLGYSAKVGISIALLGGLATMTWLRTRDLVADPLILLGFIATFYYALAYRQDQKLYYAALMGLALGFTVLNKVINATTVPFFLWYLAVPGFDIFRFKKFHWRAGSIATIPVLLAILTTGVYNEFRFGNYFDSGFRGSITFSTPPWIGFIGVIISPYKSLFLYVPLFLLIPFTIRETWQKHRREVVLILALLFSQMLLFGAWHDWGGGKNWGPRYLAPLNGLLTLLLVPLIEEAFQPKQRGQQAVLIIFSLVSLLMQILGLSARDDPFLGAASFWTPSPHLSFWGELRWDQPEQWPIWGHWLRFELTHIPVIWRWQWADLFHFDPPTLMAALIIVVLGIVGIIIAYLFRRDTMRFEALAAWMIAIGCVIFILLRSYNDPRSIKDDAKADKLWPLYYKLVTYLPELVSPLDAIIFTNRRFEFYLLDIDKSPAQRYIIAKPSQPKILETVPRLLQQDKQNRIWLVTDNLDNRQIAFATELWLRTYAQPAESYSFGDSVRLTAFEPLPSTRWPVIPAEPQLAGLVNPNDYKFNRIASLLGWNWPNLDPARPPLLKTGKTYPFELYWIYQGKAPQDTFFARLLDATDQTTIEILLTSETDHNLTLGQLMIERTEIPIPAQISPGLYQLQLGFSTPAVPAGELIFDLPTELTEVRIINPQG